MVKGLTIDCLFRTAITGFRGGALLHIHFQGKGVTRQTASRNTLVNALTKHGITNINDLIQDPNVIAIDFSDAKDAEKIAQFIRGKFRWMCDVQIYRAKRNNILY